jgi:hypothetical protein
VAHSTQRTLEVARLLSRQSHSQSAGTAAEHAAGRLGRGRARAAASGRRGAHASSSTVNCELTISW